MTETVGGGTGQTETTGGTEGIRGGRTVETGQETTAGQETGIVISRVQETEEMGDHMIGRWIMAVVMEAAGIEIEVQTPETAGSTDLRDKETVVPQDHHPEMAERGDQAQGDLEALLDESVEGSRRTVVQGMTC